MTENYWGCECVSCAKLFWRGFGVSEKLFVRQLMSNSLGILAKYANFLRLRVSELQIGAIINQ